MRHDQNHQRWNHRGPLLVDSYDPTAGFLLLRADGAQARLDQTKAALERDSRLVARTRAVLLRRLRPSFKKRDRLTLIRDGTKRLLQAMVGGDGPGAQRASEQLEKLRFYLADQHEYADAEARKRAEAAEPERLWTLSYPACGFGNAERPRGQLKSPPAVAPGSRCSNSSGSWRRKPSKSNRSTTNCGIHRSFSSRKKQSWTANAWTGWSRNKRRGRNWHPLS